MADRYFVPSAIQGDSATLTGAEAHHLQHVMRARPGTEVALFDGSGWEYRARVDQVGRDGVRLEILERLAIDRELGFSLVLGVALPKGDRQRWLVEKAVEIGIVELVPLATERGTPHPRDTSDRLRRAVVEASKQCGRNRLMQIAPPQSTDEFFSGASDLKLLAHPGGTALGAALAERPNAPAISTVRLGVGPEGGFTDQEAKQARDAGWSLIDLGQRILRVETAAIVLASTVIARLESPGGA